MDDYLKEALEIAKAQASVRIMKKEDIAAFVQKVSQGIRAVAEGEQPVVQNKEEMALEGRKFVKEKSVTCLEWNAARTVPGTRARARQSLAGHRSIKYSSIIYFHRNLFDAL